MHKDYKTNIQDKTLQNTSKSQHTLKDNLNNTNWRKKEKHREKHHNCNLRNVLWTVQYCCQRDRLTIELSMSILVYNDVKNRFKTFKKKHKRDKTLKRDINKNVCKRW